MHLVVLGHKVRANAVKFLENYALTHALVLPGRTAGTKNPDVLLLPCGTGQSTRAVCSGLWESDINVILILLADMECILAGCAHSEASH